MKAVEMRLNQLRFQARAVQARLHHLPIFKSFPVPAPDLKQGCGVEENSWTIRKLMDLDNRKVLSRKKPPLYRAF